MSYHDISRKKRILSVIIVVAIFACFVLYWNNWRKVDVAMTFHYVVATPPPVAFSLQIEDATGVEVLSFQKRLSYPTPPSVISRLRPGQYTLIGDYTDAQGAKTRVKKNIEIPKDSAQMDIYF